MTDTHLLHAYPDLAAIDQLIDTIRYKPNGAQRDLFTKRIYRLVGPLVDERAKLATKLDVGMDWLGETPEGDPRYAAREEAWNAWLSRYQSVSDALDRARRVLASGP